MSHNGNGAQKKTVSRSGKVPVGRQRSVVDARQRIPDGRHSAVFFLVMAGIAFVLAMTYHDRLFWLVVLAGAGVLNVAFFLRLNMVGARERLSQEIGRENTPETTAMDEVCRQSYDDAEEAVRNRPADDPHR